MHSTMSVLSTRRSRHRLAATLVAAGLFCLPALSLFAQPTGGADPAGGAAATAGTAATSSSTAAGNSTAAAGSTVAGGTAAKALSVDQAVKDALAHSNSVEGAIAAWQSSQQKALEAKLNMLPSVKLSGSYTRLSKLPSSDTSLTFPSPPFPPNTTINLSSPQNAFSFGVSLEYPIFTGLRLFQAARIAELQSKSKQIAIDIVRNALSFEVERAYWESVRANDNVTMMEKNLQLVRVLRGQVKDEVNQGLATQSDLLSAEERFNQAQIGLNDARASRDEASLVLASLLGEGDTGAKIAESGTGGFLGGSSSLFTYTTSPSQELFPQFAGKLDAAKLVSQALVSRPEMRTASVGVDTAEHAAKAADGGLSPTLAVIGNYTYANPNQRVLFQTNPDFTGTWNVGVAVNIDIGKLPSKAAEAMAANKAVSQAQAQAAQERTKVVLDVRKSLLSYVQAREDLSLTRGMVKQAEEDLRVTQEKYKNGLAKRSDVLQSELAVLKAHFAVTNREVGLRIAAADLARAVALPLAK